MFSLLRLVLVTALLGLSGMTISCTSEFVQNTEGCSQLQDCGGAGRTCIDGRCQSLCAKANDCGSGFSCNGVYCISLNEIAICGDGSVDVGEDCDEGANNSDILPDRCRLDCTVARCGDFVVDSNEECDDINGIDGDGCDSNCTLTGCGNGILTDGESCDNGLQNSATLPNACRPVTCTFPSCGDGVIDDGELCDDGNLEDADGCDRNCTPSACGNGIVAGTEECDWGSANSNAEPDTCRGNCILAFCGDGVVDTGEACDDGNSVDEDECSNSCTSQSCGNGQIDPGEECDNGPQNSATIPGACRPETCQNAYCGDGVRDLGEACDDGESNSDTVPNACRMDCQLPSCGDNVVDPVNGEACDDGGNNSNTTPNACRTNCQPFWCGDNVIDSGEECDGNFVFQGSCSPACEINCNGNWSNCDGVSSNGCEVQLGIAAQCGACGHNCYSNIGFSGCSPQGVCIPDSFVNAWSGNPVNAAATTLQYVYFTRQSGSLTRFPLTGSGSVSLSVTNLSAIPFAETSIQAADGDALLMIGRQAPASPLATYAVNPLGGVAYQILTIPAWNMRYADTASVRYAYMMTVAGLYRLDTAALGGSVTPTATFYSTATYYDVQTDFVVMAGLNILAVAPHSNALSLFVLADNNPTTGFEIRHPLFVGVRVYWSSYDPGTDTSIFESIKIDGTDRRIEQTLSGRVIDSESYGSNGFFLLQESGVHTAVQIKESWSQFFVLHDTMSTDVVSIVVDPYFVYYPNIVSGRIDRAAYIP